MRNLQASPVPHDRREVRDMSRITGRSQSLACPTLTAGRSRVSWVLPAEASLAVESLSRGKNSTAFEKDVKRSLR
jgi:hypothetical protein